jgi:hypothetical protein
MNTKKLLKTTIIASFIALSAVVVSHAQTSVSTSATATVSGKNSASRLSAIISRSDTAITKRITDLNALSTRIQGLKNVSATEKQNIATDVQTNITGLTALKAKIDADTDVTTAKTDAKTITQSYRIYMLVIPQGYIAAAADRVTTIVGMMNTVETKLQSRTGVDQTELATVTAKLADATIQAQNAQSGVANLQPDQGNTTVEASNTAALKAARADIKTATSDLQTARQTLKTIIAGLK